MRRVTRPLDAGLNTQAAAREVLALECTCAYEELDVRGAELRVDGAGELRERLAEQTLQVAPALVELRAHLRRRARRLRLALLLAAAAARLQVRVRVPVAGAVSCVAAGARALRGDRLEQREVLVKSEQPLAERADRHRVELHLLRLLLKGRGGVCEGEVGGGGRGL